MWVVSSRPQGRERKARCTLEARGRMAAARGSNDAQHVASSGAGGTSSKPELCVDDSGQIPFLPPALFCMACHVAVRPLERRSLARAAVRIVATGVRRFARVPHARAVSQANVGRPPSAFGPLLPRFDR